MQPAQNEAISLGEKHSHICAFSNKNNLLIHAHTGGSINLPAIDYCCSLSRFLPLADFTPKQQKEYEFAVRSSILCFWLHIRNAKKQRHRFFLM